MNGITTIAFSIMAAFFPASFPEPIPGLSREYLYDSRVSYVLGYFRESQQEHARNIGANFIAVSKDWKQVREKDISGYLGVEKRTLDVWVYQNLQDSLDSALRVFRKNVPQITINIRTFTRESEYISALDDALHGGDIPDVFLINNGWWADFKTIFEPLPQDFFSIEECNDFYFSFTCEAFQRRGKMYAIPVYVEPLVMIANEMMFRDDRVALGDRPAPSWPGFLINGVKLPKYSPEEEYIITSIKPSKRNHHIAKLFSTILLQGAKKEEITRESVKEILSFMLKIDDLAFIGKNKEQANRSYEADPYDRFLAGETAVLFGTKQTHYKMLQYFLREDKTKISESDVTVFPVPGISDNDDPVAVGEAWAFAVPRDAPNKKQAIAFTTFMAEEKSTELFAKSSGRTSARITVTDDDVFRKTAFIAENPLGQLGTFSFEQEFPENFIAMISGEKTIEEMTEFIFSYLPTYDKKEDHKPKATEESTGGSAAGASEPEDNS